MADEKYTFEQARVRLEEIVTQVRRKDVSLETSIELLEEGVRLANMCTELSDHTEWRTVVEEQESEPGSDDSATPEPVGDESADEGSSASVSDDGDSDPADAGEPAESSEE